MYLGSDFHRYWARCGLQEKHPDDVAYLHNSPFVHELLPCPFDGPLENAKVVICLANPSHDKERDAAALNKLSLLMRSGEESLPSEYDDFYSRITKPIDLPLVKLRTLVAVFNVCPYASESMKDEEIRRAAGLPSVWQAQKYLREVLIPRAQTGNIYLILIRKLYLWGISKGVEDYGLLRVIHGRAINGVMPELTGKEIQGWLIKKGYIQ